MRSLLAVLLAILTVIVSGCKESPTTRTQPVPKVVVEEVKLSVVESMLQTKGPVKPWKLANLSFQIAGKVNQGPLELGTRVIAGTVIAQLDDADYRVQVEAAQNQMSLIAVDTERTKRDLDRYEQLFSESAISQKDLDDARDQHKAALAKAGQAESAFKQANLMVEHSTLSAPFAGIILDRLIEQGEMVAVGTPVVTLGQTDRVKVAITVPSDQINAWRENARAVVFAQNGHKYDAAVYKVSPEAKGDTGSFEIELAVANTKNEFIPGQVVTVEHRIESEKGLWVPLKAVVSYGEELKYIYILNTNNSVKRSNVKLGSLSGEKVRVIEGIKAGDRIVVTMPENLREGERVEVK
ncbi:efflux transporter, RND family, MFP subunit [Desulfofarcimen acetoxidans DSM 771]|uniref:Efflux transporter, RND family, MFP subunit n=1 Tax=Desulfofarcimen acetoxidans (strain ATCC 49208 / DSM 771 / KCTC 5769 / VKM B-1644 / 5575) TaxID=485916 RepID=C8VY83_DESAS|nr:efflux RND transporter periplasmic adaptor subunit [Desulfofarcimen acetoxidans]ACV62764.1 efflux transporter, RND family, MFP subunit [Desulfofarcimen acetoxidans DSM 771]